MNKFALIISALLLLVLTGCTTRLGDFTILSTRNIELDKFPTYSRGRERVKGEDVSHIIVIIPTQLGITLEDAVDKALDTTPGAVALLDAVIRHRMFYIPYIYGQEAYIVEGTLLIDPEYASIESKGPRVAYYDKKGAMKTEKISLGEFKELQKKIN